MNEASMWFYFYVGLAVGVALTIIALWCIAMVCSNDEDFL